MASKMEEGRRPILTYLRRKSNQKKKLTAFIDFVISLASKKSLSLPMKPLMYRTFREAARQLTKVKKIKR